MAWALQFDGAQYAVFGETVLTGDYYIKVRFNPESTDSEIFLGSAGGTNGNNWLGLYGGGLEIRTNDAWSNAIPVPTGGAWYVAEVTRVGSTLTVNLLDSGENLIGTTSVTSNADFKPGVLGRYQEFTPGFSFNGLIEYVDLNNQVYLSATASDHSNTGSQPVLTDTIGGNSATGVNFPEDGGAWDDLVGDVVTYDINLTTLNSSSQFNAIDLLYNRQLSINTLNSSAQFNDITLSYLQSITLDLGTLESTGQFDDLSLQYNRVISLGELSTSGQFNSLNFDYIQNGVTYQLSLDALNSSAQFNDIDITYNRVFNLSGQSSSAYFGDLDLSKGLLFALNSLSSTAQFNEVQLLHNKVLSISELSSVASFKSIQLDYSGFVEQLIDTYTIAYAPDLISVNYQNDSITVRYKD